jgi:hypothetical protein
VVPMRMGQDHGVYGLGRMLTREGVLKISAPARGHCPRTRRPPARMSRQVTAMMRVGSIPAQGALTASGAWAKYLVSRYSSYRHHQAVNSPTWKRWNCSRVASHHGIASLGRLHHYGCTLINSMPNRFRLLCRQLADQRSSPDRCGG